MGSYVSSSQTLFDCLLAKQLIVFFSHTKSAPPSVLFLHNKSAPTISHTQQNRVIFLVDNILRHRLGPAPPTKLAIFLGSYASAGLERDLSSSSEASGAQCHQLAPRKQNGKLMQKPQGGCLDGVQIS